MFLHIKIFVFERNNYKSDGLRHVFSFYISSNYSFVYMYFKVFFCSMISKDIIYNKFYLNDVIFLKLVIYINHLNRKIF